MAINIGTNFDYHGKLPNFDRDKFKTKAAMMAFDENSIDEGHLSYCEEDGNIYQYKSANTVDATTGKWRIFKTDVVVDAALNGTSKNPIQNKAVFEALKLKADAVALGKYQPKYKADYVATKDFNYSELPESANVIDLNGYTMTVNIAGTVSTKTIYNGAVFIAANDVTFDSVYAYNTNINVEQDGSSIAYTDVDSHYYNCTIQNIYVQSETQFMWCHVLSSEFHTPGSYSIASEFSSCTFTLEQQEDYPMTLGNFIIVDGVQYNKCIINNGKPTEAGFESNITTPTLPGNAPSCEAVNAKLANYATKTELNSKADTSALNDYLTKSDASNRYLTITNANATYVTKDSLNNELNQLVEEINLKLDDTVAASTYLRKDDANTTYAKKTDITNMYKFKGTKTNYADLPTAGVVTCDVWNITNADATHNIKAGDNVAWNGTAWDNLSGIVDLSGYATTTTTDTISADVKKLMDKAFPFTVKVSLDKTLAKKGTSQPVKLTITPKIGDNNTEVDAIMINGEEHHGTIPYVYSTTATTTTTYNVRADKTGRNSAQGSATITFVNPSYDGAVAANFTVTEANIKALTEALRSGKGGTRTFNLNNQKVCIAYPKSFGAATSIKDANGFDYLASYTRSELSVNGELYYVYLLANATTITDMKQTLS